MPYRASRIAVSAGIAIFLLVAVLLGLAAATPPPRQFVITPQSRIEPAQYAAWHRLGSWLAGRRYVLLTFDDGPYGKGVDEQILHVLQRHRAHALFFLVCSHVTPATIHVPAKILATGNLIGNHSFDHRHVTGMSDAELQHEVAGCSERLHALTGRQPRYFRPPFGQRSAQLQLAIDSAGMRQVLWSANSEDTWQTEPDQIVRWSLEETENGSILLLHDRPTTAKALDRVLTSLEQRGFEFVLPRKALRRCVHNGKVAGRRASRTSLPNTIGP